MHELRPQTPQGAISDAVVAPVDAPIDQAPAAPVDMDRRSFLRRLGVVGFGAAIGGGVIKGVMDAQGQEAPAVATPGTTPDVASKPLFTNTTEAETGISPAENFRRQLTERVFVGFKDSDLLVGGAVNLDGAPQERGQAAFSKRTLTSGEAQADFMREADNPRAQAVRRYFENAINFKIGAGLAGSEEYGRIFDTGEAFTIVQIPNLPAAVEDTSHFVDGELKITKGVRKVEAGDAFLIYSDKDGNIDPALTGRCDCGNPHVTVIRPLVPGENPPSIEQPPRPDEPTYEPKFDDGHTPGNPNVPADQDDGIPDRPGQGPAGQPADPVTGTIKSETTVAPPSSAAPNTQAPTTSGRPPASTAPAPTSTNPPAPATSTVATTAPQAGPLPTQP